MDGGPQRPAPSNPNRLVVDLDPGPGAGLAECCRVALWCATSSPTRGLSAAPVTSGSKGLHLYAALPGRRNADAVRDLARELAQELTGEHPEEVLWRMTKSLRAGKVFLDWSQNTGAKTTISPYSLRGRDRPYVAAPRSWDEIEQGAATASCSCSWTRCWPASTRTGTSSATCWARSEKARHVRNPPLPRDGGDPQRDDASIAA